MPVSRGRAGRPWERAKAIVRARGDRCARCGRPIDYSLPPNDRWAFTAGHIIAVVDLPEDSPLLVDPANLQAEHRSCGSTAGNLARQGRGRRHRTTRRW